MTDAALNALPTTVSDDLESPARRALRRLLKRKGAVAGIVVIVAFVLLALFAPLVVPYDPIATSWSLVRKAPSAQPGEIVVALIEEEATVKRYYPEGDRVRFQPANSTMQQVLDAFPGARRLSVDSSPGSRS